MTNAVHAGGAELPAGTKLGPYVIERELGSGGMGSVYRAHDSRLDRDVAIKIIRSPYCNDEGRRRRFETEARAAARVVHSNIVAVYDVGEENGTPYIVSELVPGGTLADRMRERLPLNEAMTIAIAVADALAEAHRNGVIHRDLKPENILLTTAGTPKISDFGLSKFLEPEPPVDPDAITAAGRLTAEGAILGTPAYMSPEQAAGSAADFRADQFSFGVMLMEMLTGEAPFRRNSSVQTLAAILNDEPDYTRLARLAPSRVAAVVERCLAKDPKRRYASTDDLVHDLRVATAAPPRHWQRRLAIPLGIIAAAVLAVSLFLIWRRSATSEAKIESLAILPLQNFSGDKSQDYFAEGLTEELTSQLASVRALRVASRTSASAYRGTTKPLSAVAQDLGVDALIEGSVVRSGDETRVTIQLIDGRTDRHVWSHSFESRGPNVLALERQMAAEIADRVRASVSPDERARLSSPPTTNSEAYDAFLHATYKMRTAFGSTADAAAALQYAEKAVALDPSFAEAYVKVAQACQANIFMGMGGQDLDEKGFVAVQKALALNPTLAEAYVARGNLQYNRWHGYDIASGLADYRHATLLSPNSAEVHHGLGADLTHLGLHEEAAKEFRTALRLDPNNEGSKFRLARALWQSNRFSEALETYERYGVNTFEKPVTLAYLGRNADAWRALDDGLKSAPQQRDARFEADYAAVRALLYAMDGKAAEVGPQIARSAAGGQSGTHFHHAAFLLAAACAEIGDAPQAVHWLEFAANTGMPNYPLFRENPSMKKLQGNPQYEKFMSDLRLRWDQIASQVK